MCKALIVSVSAFVFLFTSSCSNNSGHKTAATLKNTMHGDTLHLKDNASIPVHNLFYPDSSADTNLVVREGNVSVYSVGRYDVDFVVKLENQTYKSFKVWEEDMLEFKGCDYVHSQQVNNRGNEEVVICFEIEGEHSYGDEYGGGWYEKNKWFQVWDIDDSIIIFQCIPYKDYMNSEEGKDYFGFYKYDCQITRDNKIILSNPMKKIKDKIMPSKAKKLDVRMGTYQFQNDSFIWVSSKL